MNTDRGSSRRSALLVDGRYARLSGDDDSSGVAMADQDGIRTPGKYYADDAGSMADDASSYYSGGSQRDSRRSFRDGDRGRYSGRGDDGYDVSGRSRRSYDDPLSPAPATADALRADYDDDGDAAAGGRLDVPSDTARATMLPFTGQDAVPAPQVRERSNPRERRPVDAGRGMSSSLSSRGSRRGGSSTAGGVGHHVGSMAGDSTVSTVSSHDDDGGGGVWGWLWGTG